MSDTVETWKKRVATGNRTGVAVGALAWSQAPDADQRKDIGSGMTSA